MLFRLLIPLLSGASLTLVGCRTDLARCADDGDCRNGTRCVDAFCVPWSPGGDVAAEDVGRDVTVLEGDTRLDAVDDARADVAQDVDLDIGTDTDAETGADANDAAEVGPPNACGGTVFLDFEDIQAAPGDPCGDCGDGTLVCDGPNALRCQSARPLNACGNCEPLEAQPGAVCGDCREGVVVCDEETGGTACVLRPGQRPPNLCGGCGLLQNTPGDPCGRCGNARYVCDGTDAVRCDDALVTCSWGQPCTDDTGCGADLTAVDGTLSYLPGECDAVQGRCVPVGMRFVPAGVFEMGAAAGTPFWQSNEGPVREVTLSRSFLLQPFEVSQVAFATLTGRNPSGFATCGDNCPVERVSWTDAALFANAMSDAEGLPRCYTIAADGAVLVDAATFVSCLGYRLPTEAEWEYAYRAGTRTSLYNGELTVPRNGRDPVLDLIGGYRRNSLGQTYPAGQLIPNEFGLYDMSGNVFEWVNDWFGSYDRAATVDPTGPEVGTDRAFRGGSWNSYASTHRASARTAGNPATRLQDTIGFRLARALPLGVCGDGVQDGTETDVDCGGASCNPCPIGARCLVDSDCAEGGCVEGRCGE